MIPPPAEDPINLGGDGSARNQPSGRRADALSAGLDAEPSAAEAALFAIRNMLQLAKTSMMFNDRWVNAPGYISDAALWIERSISVAEEATRAAPASPAEQSARPRDEPAKALSNNPTQEEE